MLKRNKIVIFSGVISILLVLISTIHSRELDMGRSVEELKQELESKGIEQLIEEIKKKSFPANANEISRLGSLKDSRLVEPIISHFLINKEIDRGVRSFAVSALGRLADERAIEPLYDVLRNEEDGSYTRKKAASALAKIGTPKAVDLLLEAWEQEKDEKVLKGIAIALGKTDSSKALDFLINILKNDPEKTHRKYAALALGQSQFKKAESCLKKAAISDPSSEVRFNAQRSLADLKISKLQDQQTRIKYDKNVYNAQKRLIALGYQPGPVDGKIGKKTKSALKEFQKDNNLPATGSINLETLRKLGLKIQKVEVAKSEDNCLKETTTCDPYGKPESIVLINMAGKKVAERNFVFDGSFIVSECLIDVSNGKVIKKWTYDARGQRNEPYKFLCLDEEGKIVRDKSGHPILVKPFRARQKQVSKIRYSDFNPFIKAGKDTTIYPCENCKNETNGLASFVW